MARKLSYKYEIEKQEKSLSQAKCPISLIALYLVVPQDNTTIDQIMARFHLIKAITTTMITTMATTVNKTKTLISVTTDRSEV